MPSFDGSNDQNHLIPYDDRPNIQFVFHLAGKTTLSISPSIVNTFGGYPIRIVGFCNPEPVFVKCRFNGKQTVTGKKLNAYAVSCMVPSIGTIGQVQLEVSIDDGRRYLAKTTITLGKAAT